MSTVKTKTRRPRDDAGRTADLFSQPPSPPAPPRGGEAPPRAPDEPTLSQFAARAYLAYAMSVVKGRALPSVEDGQKPVQRRILYTMREMGNRSDAPHKKSARIVGDVIGKYHPHGDVAVYDAAVRMAQDFTLRYPLVDGQGNFGSRDGDSPAAYRYTEVRLTPFAEHVLLSELDRGTVDFIDNYDGSLQEPKLLPARLPVMLLNGASGIAVGMATEIPPHNLKEVAEACAQTLEAGDGAKPVTRPVKGPDFPGGGQIISPREEIKRAYETGRGSVRVRARWDVEKLARGQYRIAVKELPPNTSMAKVLAEIDELTNPKPRAGKKSLTPEQLSVKSAALALLESARDDSDGEHPVRLVLEPRTGKVEPQELMDFLLAHTSMEANVPMNLVAIGTDGRPRQMGLAETIGDWARFRLDVLERRLKHRAGEVADRVHILEGRMIAFLSIEQVIKVIRAADEPKPELVKKFKLSERQAEDILEIRLRQLARLEGIRIEKELGDLRKEAASLKKLLASPAERRKLAAKEVREDAERFGDARRTVIEEAERITVSMVETVADEPITVILSRNGFLRARSGHGIDRGALAWKEGDGELAIRETRTIHAIVLFGANGRVFNVRAADIPGGKGDGVPVSSLAETAGTPVVGMLSGPAEVAVLLATSGGNALRTKVEGLVTRIRAGKQFVSLDEGEALLAPSVIPPEAREVAALSAEGRLLVFPLEEVKELAGGGKGVMAMRLHEGERMLALVPVAGELRIAAIKRGDKPGTLDVGASDLEHYRGARARTGRVLQAPFKRVEGFVEASADAAGPAK
ncbi:MAG TPA: DNA topoisomerase IV subunit A [Usitatibacter sp.]|nr:DNA topoisomerase IV subunit A [Usitatibacter sp.]